MSAWKSLVSASILLVWLLPLHAFPFRFFGNASNCSFIFSKVFSVGSKQHHGKNDQKRFNGIASRLKASGLLSNFEFVPGTITVKGTFIESGYSKWRRCVEMMPLRGRLKCDDPERHSEPIFIHELGHAIFSDSFTKWITEKTGGSSIMAKIKKMDQESPTYFDDVEKLLEPMALKLGVSPKKLYKIIFDGVERSKYEELFSDLLPSLFLRDPNSMPPALERQDGADPRYEFRSFNSRELPIAWTSEQKHEYFTPVRAFIGKVFFSRLLQYDPVKSRHLLEAVFRICSEDYLNHQIGKSAITSLYAHNIELINSLNAELIRLGVVSSMPKLPPDRRSE